MSSLRSPLSSLIRRSGRIWGISRPFGQLSPTRRRVAHVLLTRSPLTSASHWYIEGLRPSNSLKRLGTTAAQKSIEINLSPFKRSSSLSFRGLEHSPNVSVRSTDSFDLHVLGTPPAFVLSQDQTLRDTSVSHSPPRGRGGFQIRPKYGPLVTWKLLLEVGGIFTFQGTVILKPFRLSFCSVRLRLRFYFKPIYRVQKII